MVFMGYKRKNGSIGIRNYVAVVSTVGCINEVTMRIAKNARGAVPFLHHQGCCQLSPDLSMVKRVLCGIAQNPNVGAVLLVSLGCESISAEDIRAEVIPYKPVEIVRLNESDGIGRTVVIGLRHIRNLRKQMVQKKVYADIKNLIVGVKCGASDATSGIASNPAVGYAVDLLIDNKATVIFGETTEVIGAEHILASRAVTEVVKEKLLKKVQNIEEKVKTFGVDMRGGQPTAGNIKGGITTIEEKSLGAIVKSGSRPIQDVIEYGEKPPGSGLYFMDSPGREMEFLTGLASSGCQIIIFSTGLGAPQGFPIVPVLKITGNSKTFIELNDHMDMDVSGIIRGEETIEEAGVRIMNEVIEIASGKAVKAEIVGFDATGINTDIYTTGPVI